MTNSILEEFGLTVTFDQPTDKQREDSKKHHIDKAKKAAKKQQGTKEANRARPWTEKGSTSFLNTSAQAGGVAANLFKIVGQGGRPTKFVEEKKR